nr:rhamnan synthesis F family protein [Litorivivens lipolytica]
MTRRAILFASYSRDGVVGSHVLRLIRELTHYAETIIFVSASGKSIDLSSVRPFCDLAISRENVGYDFKSWHVALGVLDKPDQYDQVILMNDSVFGPLYSMDRIFGWLDESGLDCAGLSSSMQLGYHLQSYFLCFSSRLIKDGVLARFLSSVVQEDCKSSIVRKYEVGLSHMLLAEHWRIGAYYDVKELRGWQRLLAVFRNGKNKGRGYFQLSKRALRGDVGNPSLSHWRSLIESGVPFVKVQLLRDNPLGMNLGRIHRYLERFPVYDDIQDYLK